ncbi:MAG: hypothetical protein A4S09_16190 [Proteobacteria bacterium SG_bin7]|nr:MAG: hypothetical protein A4S09_16190 [Proteobacteria bacterium SG_bin7]
MKKLNILGFFLLVSAFENSAHAWEKILTCDGGSAVVDVNTSERRNVQLVIRDQHVVNYLRPTGAFNTNNNGEIIVSGWQSQGIFQPRDFHGFSNSFTSAHDKTIYVWRDGAGLKIKVEASGTRVGTCGGQCEDPTSSSCEGRCNETYKYEVANWIFRYCI